MSHSHSAIDTDKLVPDSTDMLVEFLGNSDKLVDSDKRWRYADHRNSPESTAVPGSDRHHHTEHDPYDELDEGVDNYISEKVGGDHNVFTHADTARTETDRGYSDTDAEDFGPTLFDANKQKPMTKDELMLAKLNMLRKLGELKQCGVKLSQNYGLDSDLKMMEYEYKLHSDIRAKQNSVQWMGHMLIGIIKGGELLNDNFNPFDIKLEGLSTKVSSDMNSYYTVLGEIYEKYNQPGKQMAPEFKLLMMITGAALSMQVNRALPGFMGGIANSVQNDESIKDDLRKKAAAESGNQGSSGSSGERAEGMANTGGPGPVSYAESQHAMASQQVADLKFMREKEAEYQRSMRQAEMARQRGGFILSSEQPESDREPREPQREEPQYTRDQIEAMRREKEQREVRYLEALRQKAKINSNAYRNGSSQGGDFDRARMQDLERQTRNLDDLLGSLEDEDDDPRKGFRSHPERIVTRRPEPARKVKSRSSQRSARRSERDDNRSTMSSASSVSYNPKLKQIMRDTSKKTTTKKTKSRSKDTRSYDDIKPDSISFGSTDKKKKKRDVTVKFDRLSDSSNPPKVSPKNKDTRSKDMMDDMDFGTISFGSSKKGVTQSFKTG
jgi:hypothetical protein